MINQRFDNEVPVRIPIEIPVRVPVRAPVGVQIGLAARTDPEYDYTYSFEPIYQLLRMAGLMPFSVTCDSYGEIEGAAVTACDILWMMISIVIYISMALPTIFNIHLPRIDSVVYSLHLADYIFLAIVFAYGVILMVLDFFHRFKIVQMLKMFNKFDKEVSCLQFNFQFTFI